jgi:hypothetical protein
MVTSCTITTRSCGWIHPTYATTPFGRMVELPLLAISSGQIPQIGCPPSTSTSLLHTRSTWLPTCAPRKAAPWQWNSSPSQIPSLQSDPSLLLSPPFPGQNLPILPLGHCARSRLLPRRAPRLPIPPPRSLVLPSHLQHQVPLHLLFLNPHLSHTIHLSATLSLAYLREFLRFPMLLFCQLPHPLLLLLRPPISRADSNYGHMEPHQAHPLLHHRSPHRNKNSPTPSSLRPPRLHLVQHAKPSTTYIQLWTTPHFNLGQTQVTPVARATTSETSDAETPLVLPPAHAAATRTHAHATTNVTSGTVPHLVLPPAHAVARRNHAPTVTMRMGHALPLRLPAALDVRRTRETRTLAFANPGATTVIGMPPEEDDSEFSFSQRPCARHTMLFLLFRRLF